MNVITINKIIDFLSSIQNGSALFLATIIVLSALIFAGYALSTVIRVLENKNK